MSYPKLRKLVKNKFRRNISVFALHKYAKKLGFGRDRSAAKRNQQLKPLDFSQTYLDEKMIEAIDGFMLGDGHLYIEKRCKTEVARITCGLEYEEFCRYSMSFFDIYFPHIGKYKQKKMRSGIVWAGRTRMHPDLFSQQRRWYHLREVQPTLFDEPKMKWIKEPPDDVRLTPLSLLLWYLGDGCVVCDEKANTVMLRLSTDDFSPSRVRFLAKKLCDIGIDCHRNGDNRIYIESQAVPRFFKMIGYKSPIKCYQYKFELPNNRATAIRMSAVCKELNIPYNRMAYFVKEGWVPFFRPHEKSRPWFLPEHVETIKTMVKSGEFLKDRRK